MSNESNTFWTQTLSTWILARPVYASATVPVRKIACIHRGGDSNTDSEYQCGITLLQASIYGLQKTLHSDTVNSGLFMAYYRPLVFDWDCERSQDNANIQETIFMVLDYGANPNLLGGRPKYPIEIAAGVCPPVVIQGLIEAAFILLC